MGKVGASLLVKGRLRNGGNIHKALCLDSTTTPDRHHSASSKHLNWYSHIPQAMARLCPFMVDVCKHCIEFWPLILTHCSTKKPQNQFLIKIGNSGQNREKKGHRDRAPKTPTKTPRDPRNTQNTHREGNRGTLGFA